MAAEPLWCTLALNLPESDESWLEEFADGFFDLASRFDVALIGGDTVRGPLAMTVTVHGRVRSEQQVSRSGAGPGDDIFLTGNVGEAAAGLRLLTGARVSDTGAAERLRARFLYPDARVEAGRLLAGFATAMIDVSDGLDVDLSRMLGASGAGADVDTAGIPLSVDLVSAFGTEDALHLALTGGDDYELCFTAKAGHGAEIEAAINGVGGSVTHIGQVGAEPGLRWTGDGRPFAVADGSFRHFS
jgi:thiamine-monophosphate kinase